MFIQRSFRRGVALLLGLLLIAPWRAGAESKEYQVKAAFLFNFSHFVSWPPSAFASASTPFRIGVLGDNPFGTALEQTVQGETIDNRKLEIVPAREAAELKDCQIIFISKSEAGRVGEILAKLDSRPVLTVSEIDGFGKSGGMIRLYLEGQKVRFEINAAVAQQSGLKMSSQLLSLGKIVQSERPAK